EHAVEVLAVLRHHINAARAEALHVEDRQHEQRALDLRGRLLQEPERGLDAAVLRSVHSGGDEKAGSGLLALDQAERNLDIRDGANDAVLDARRPGPERRQLRDHSIPSRSWRIWGTPAAPEALAPVKAMAKPR